MLKKNRNDRKFFESSVVENEFHFFYKFVHYPMAIASVSLKLLLEKALNV